MTQRDCDDCRYCILEGTEEPCKSCNATDEGFTNWKKREHPTMTNADRIRAMTDDELAEAISSIPMCVGTDDDKDCENDGCKGCFLKWLQQPAEEDV